MSEQKKLGVHLQLSVFRETETYQVVNIKTFDGLEMPYLFAFGFTEKGEPVLKRKENAFYEFRGGVTSHVNLNHPFNNGLNVNLLRIIGFDAVVFMVSNYGLGITKAEIEAKVKTLIENDAHTIYFYKQSNVYGMGKPYDFTDSWLISGKDAILDLEHWNTFLKSIGSDFRILTPKTRRLLRKLEYQKLQAEEV
jgi:hypothetical protein